MSDREPHKRKGDGMDLPEGKTCGDCSNYRWCMMNDGRVREDNRCYSNPVRFKEKDQ